MAQDISFLSLDYDLPLDFSVLSRNFDDRLSTRSFLRENDAENPNPLSSTNNNYAIKRKALPSEPHIETQDTSHLTMEIGDFKLQRPGKPTARMKAKQFWEGLLPGWRKGLALNSLYTTIVLLINILWLLITMTNFEESEQQGIYTIYKGSCSHTGRINSVLHVLINILSTALLGSSNYAIQCLLAPTRKEVERAHRKKKWLSIGIPNIRSLFWISWRRKLIVLLLAISTWPLHLFWNSVVFKTLQANQYGVLVVSSDFVSSPTFDDNLGNLVSLTQLSGAPGFNSTSAYEYGFNSTSFLNFSESLYNDTNEPKSMARLENAECIKSYFPLILTDWRNLILVTNTTQLLLPPGQSLGNGSILSYMDSQEWQKTFTGGWTYPYFICEDGTDCALGSALKNADNWTVAVDVLIFEGEIDGDEIGLWKPDSYQIDYCLSEIVEEVCQVQLLLPLMALVIVCNLIKLLCIISTIFTFQEPPLVIIGDALASFLDQKEDSSLSKSKLVAVKRVVHWRHAARSDFAVTILLSLVSLAIASVLLRTGVSSAQSSGQAFKSLGYGQVNPSALILIAQDDIPQSFWLLIAMILLVNSPQIVLTLLYLIYNRTCTKMLAMYEWTKFIQRRSLRVSQPTGIQRSTFWLHLPYRYSVPLLIASSLMHWIISESLFLVRVAFYDRDGLPVNPNNPGERSGATSIVALPGYSPEAILSAIILGSIMILSLILLSFRKFGSAIGMPLVGNNSWMISTVCHRPDDDKKAASKLVKWGAVSHAEGDRPGHCCLTSFEVEMPIKGGEYI